MRKPQHAPDILTHTGTSGGHEYRGQAKTIANPTAAMANSPAASPSKPSVRLTALLSPEKMTTDDRKYNDSNFVPRKKGRALTMFL